MNTLINRLKNLEDNFTERKLEGAKPEELRRTIVAFANSVPAERTAVLFIGVAETADIKGVSNPEAMQKKMRSICERDCFPPIEYRCEVLNIEGSNIVAVEVLHNNNGPHFSGPAYIRKGSESVIASEEAFNDLVKRRRNKVYEIMKWQDKVITVIALRKKLGSTKPISGSMHRESCECRIEECTAHYIRLKNIANDQYLSEPLEKVSISYDEKKYRLMLIVE